MSYIGGDLRMKSSKQTVKYSCNFVKLEIQLNVTTSSEIIAQLRKHNYTVDQTARCPNNTFCSGASSRPTSKA